HPTTRDRPRNMQSIALAKQMDRRVKPGDDGGGSSPRRLTHQAVTLAPAPPVMPGRRPGIHDLGVARAA
ncbi:hypothetical protein, partial [Hansschlegelia zhihuaiae]|uniref:hypothetical protein n=1 Tax=Hansschlegelia zhihuaiae TaxID=405005 RepID=UPI0019D44ED7